MSNVKDFIITIEEHKVITKLKTNIRESHNSPQRFGVTVAVSLTTLIALFLYVGKCVYASPLIWAKQG